MDEIKNILRCSVVHLPIRYLGIPLGANPKKVSTWKPVLEKIENRLALWKAKLLSRAGRLVLIKSVLNNLPLYYLSIFKMLKIVAHIIIKMQRKFFCSIDERQKRIPLVDWSTIQKSKELGGLGVGDLVIKNAALLFKWWWHFSKGDMSLWKEW